MLSELFQSNPKEYVSAKYTTVNFFYKISCVTRPVALHVREPNNLR